MESIFEELEEWGCDVTGALSRFLDDTELYLTCLDTVITDKEWSKLGMALAEGNLKEAFDSAQTLKGVFANMGLKPMFRLVECLVEPLREGSMEDLMLEYHRLLEANDYLRDILERYEH